MTDKPDLVITFTTSPDDKATHKLTIGGTAPNGTWFAKVDERDGTFTTTDLNVLQLPLASQPSPTPASSAPSRSSLSHAPRRFIWRLSENTFRLLSPCTGNVSTARRLSRRPIESVLRRWSRRYAPSISYNGGPEMLYCLGSGKTIRSDWFGPEMNLRDRSRTFIKLDNSAVVFSGRFSIS